MSTSQFARFRHKALESPERQIRLLSVLPSPTGNQARYQLKTYILGGNKTPHFYAISYEWGPEHLLHDIIIDDQVFAIRSNLKDCLERLGSADEGFYRPVWVDAICIDQTNLAERNAQVKIMGEIYSSAMLVLAWFGKQAPANGTLTKAVECLQDWQASREYLNLLDHAKRQRHQLNSSQHHSPPQLLSLADPYGSLWSCLRHLCEQTYWTRLWIVQELVKAKELLLMWGDEQIPWNVLSAAFRTIDLNELRINTTEARFAPWDLIARSIPFQVWHQRDGSKQERSLLHLMETYKLSDCSVAHDKAYALTGISKDAHLLQVVYEKSLPDLYVDLMDLAKTGPECIKYSHLILDALHLDPRQPHSGMGATSLRGHKAECSATLVGKVEAIKRVDLEAPSMNMETEVLELLVNAHALLTEEVIDGTARWASETHAMLQHHFRGTYSELIFFWLSTGQVGAALSPVFVDDDVFCLAQEHQNRTLFFRVAGAEQTDDDDRSARTGYESPQMASPTQSQSTFFSESGADSTTRVWLSGFEIVSSPGADGNPVSEETPMVLKIPYSELVAMDILLNFDLEEQPDSITDLNMEVRNVRSDVPRRRSTRDSDSIPDVIDQAMRWSSGRPVRSSTWPTQTAGHAFIDALSREMRSQLFVSEGTSLNSPD